MQIFFNIHTLYCFEDIHISFSNYFLCNFKLSFCDEIICTIKFVYSFNIKQKRKVSFFFFFVNDFLLLINKPCSDNPEFQLFILKVEKISNKTFFRFYHDTFQILQIFTHTSLRKIYHILTPK